MRSLSQTELNELTNEERKEVKRLRNYWGYKYVFKCQNKACGRVFGSDFEHTNGYCPICSERIKGRVSRGENVKS